MGARRGPARSATLLSDRSAGKIFGSSDEIACVIGFDGRIAEVNAGWMRDLGANIDKAGSVMYVDLVHPDDRECTVRSIQALKTGKLSTTEIENRFRREDGTYRLVRWHYNVERSEELLYGLGHDITDLKTRQADLDADAQTRQADLDTDARYRLIVDATEALAITDANDIYTYVSPGFLPLLGYLPEELIGKPVTSLIHQEDRAVAAASRKQAARTAGTHSVSLRFRRKDGSYAWIESRTMSVFDPTTGALRETQAVMRDISERKEAQLAVERQAVTDALTGLDNRLLLNDRLNQALRRLRRTPGLVGVLMLDLDHFKVINDTLGHQIGDGVLVAVARRLQGLARPDDTVARFGGDEFVIVVQGMRTTSDLTSFAERIVTGMREPLRIGDEEIVTTVSVGIAVTSMPDHLPADLIREADLALYRAKGSGRDRHEVFGEALQIRAVERLERINRTLSLIPSDRRARQPLRVIPLTVLRPSCDLGQQAIELLHRVPFPVRHLLKGLGASDHSGWDLLSYLFFDSGYTTKLLQLGYDDTMGHWQQAPPDTIEALLGVMGATADEPAPGPVVVISPGRPVAVLGTGRLTLEDGTALDVHGEAPPDLPLGYHRFESEDGSGDKRVIITASLSSGITLYQRFSVRNRY